MTSRRTAPKEVSTGPATIVRRIDPAFTDERGTIADILSHEPIEHVAIITTRSGAIRGNHYHSKTVQWIYMIHGRMRLTSQRPGGPIQSVILEQGDLGVSRPLERHAMVALEDTVFLALCHGPRGGKEFESDTVRLAEPEILERPEPR